MTVLGSALALPDGREVMLYRATAADTEKCAVRAIPGQAMGNQAR